LVVDVGKKAEMNCAISGYAAEVTWMKNGKEIEDAGTQANRRVRFVGEMRTLVIARVQEGDHGMYQCFAKNSRESAQAAARLILGGENSIRFRK
jgi:hypothetical protein